LKEIVHPFQRQNQRKPSGKKYIKGISEVLINFKRFLKEEANVFIVANDKLI
jgi:hypothetical protein